MLIVLIGIFRFSQYSNYRKLAATANIHAKSIFITIHCITSNISENSISCCCFCDNHHLPDLFFSVVFLAHTQKSHKLVPRITTYTNIKLCAHSINWKKIKWKSHSFSSNSIEFFRLIFIVFFLFFLILFFSQLNPN